VGPAVYVRQIRLEGNTVFSDEELSEITRRYENRTITSEELQALRDEITRFYIDRGYINSGAVIPDQEVVQGVVTLRVVEGQLTEVRIAGLSVLERDFVEDRIRLGARRPLNVIELQDQLQLLLADPAIAKIDGRLGPGAQPGQSRLDVDVAEAPVFQFGLGFSNDRSPSVGENRGEFQVGLRSIFGYSDPFYARFGLTSGLREASVEYSLPITASGLRLQVYGESTDADVVERPFDTLDIESRTETIEGGLYYPFYRTLRNKLALELNLSRRRSRTFLLGEPFSFSPGVRDGESNVTAIRFSQEWQYRARDQAFLVLSTFSHGIDALGATINSSGPDGEFFAWHGFAQWARRFSESGFGLYVRVESQFAFDPLLPLEKFAIGGFDTVRGYRENLLVRDSGVAVSVEPRIPLFTFDPLKLGRKPDDGIVFLAPFVDYGRSWVNVGSTPRPRVLASVGVGLRWQMGYRTHALIYWGHALNDVPEPARKSLQDRGIHFELRVQLF